jgi:putative lipoprotein
MACTRKEWKTFVGAALLLATASGCASNLPATAVGEGKTSANLTGMVICRVRTVLPPDAYVQVELVDISRQDAPGRTIAMKEIAPEGRQFPLPFSIAYGPAAIDPTHTYAVQVRIVAGQRLLFVNTSTYKVLTNGVRSNVEVVVELIPGSGY